MSGFPDPIREGLKAGWKVIDATSTNRPATLECDVVIIGTGAGGGVAAEILAQAGLKLVLIEEGPLKSSSDFNMLEATAYPTLYQESAARKTKDKAINILQGRAVGGSTTVNWTSSFTTPEKTLDWWVKHFGLTDYNSASLAPWFAQAQNRLGIAPWIMPPNENNDLLKRGAAVLGIPAAAIARNVRNCMNLGYCGMGCPVNAKQSMLVTTIPAALERGATLLTRARAWQFEFDKKNIRQLTVQWLDAAGLSASGQTVNIKAKHYVLAGGAINSPALLLRSKAPDPNSLAGTRTFLHPTVVSSAVMLNAVEGFSGAPQTVYTDHFLDTQEIDAAIGFKLEAPPIHPLLFASTMHGFGDSHASGMANFAKTHALIALMRDGFHPQSVGGKVQLRSDGTAVLDYPLNDYFFDGAKRAFLAMAEIQFAAGAKTVFPVHELAQGYSTWAQAKLAINQLQFKPLLTRVVSAHVMGGCTMAANDTAGLIRPDGQHFHVNNLSVFDGSLFPTSIGANPQLSIYATSSKLASALASKLTGKKDLTLLAV